MFRAVRGLSVALAVLLAIAACDSTSGDDAADTDSTASIPSVVVTTGIWSDVVRNVACDDSVSVTTIIPAGGDPHTFEPSLRDRETMDDADIVIANGLGLEESIHDTLEAVAEAGTPVFEFGDHIATIEFDLAAAHGHGAEDDEAGERDEDDHAEGDADEEEGHDEDGGADPHIWLDLQKVANALPAVAGALIDAGADADTVNRCLAEYRQEMVDADAKILEIVDTVPDERRALVTNHDSLGYFADRYGFEVIGTVIPANTTSAETNPAALHELAEIIEHEGVPAVFSETTSADDDAQALATAAGDVSVVPLLTGSLAPEGEIGDTLIDLLLHNAQAIADALNSGSS